MSALNPIRLQSLPLRFRMTLWLVAFFSPAAYFLLLMLADRFNIPAPPEMVVASLLYTIPFIALLVCGSVVWMSGMTVARKFGWLLFTLFGLLFQFGFLLVVITMATGYA